MRTKALLSVLVLFSLLASCNMPAGQVPVTAPSEVVPVSLDADAMATAVELTAIARVTEIAGSAMPATSAVTATPTATLTSAPAAAGPCTPTITATVNANVRSGPDTAYEIVGLLSQGQTTTIVGRNDAFTWWYIDYPGVAGNHAWIAGSVVTSACVPSVVQVVAAPPLPTATAVEVADNSSSNDSNSGNNLLPLQPINPNLLNALRPDLTVVNMDVPGSILLGATVDVTVKVKNTGNTTASNFTVQWWAGSQLGCSWLVDALAAGAAKNLNCPYTFPNVGDYSVKTVVDSGATVTETNENNNASKKTVQVMKIKLIPITLVAP